MDEQLARAGDRAREVAQKLAEDVTQAVQAVEERFSQLRSGTADERERTVAALRGVYDQAVGDMTGMLKRSVDGLGDIARQMREMTGTITGELETTRSELKRGVLALPKETEESTAAIRRVVSDQIKALNALAEIAARHGAAQEVAEPRRDYGAAAVSERGGRRGLPPAPRLQTRGGEPSAAQRAEQGWSDDGTPGSGDGGGWLSGLLARASRDEPGAPQGRRADQSSASPDRTVRNALESLDSLSVDIARMIDHQAVMELWDRYRRGERNVFTRRLYTLQGQKTFDEIRTKYTDDGEFRHTVDRYISEFERLLDEVERGGRDSKTYLTSETGKVYTMLAHAAGRFEERG
jgi:hypothetical protein